MISATYVSVESRVRFVIIHECGPAAWTTCGRPMSEGKTMLAREAQRYRGQLCQYGCFKGRQLPIARYR